MSQEEYFKQLEEYYSRFSKEELEKAKELGKKYFPNSENIWARETYLKNIEQQKTIIACLEMAEWMNNKLIEKACEKLVEIDLEDEDTEDVSNEEQDPIYVLSNHFFKKFKESMEDEI